MAHSSYYLGKVNSLQVDINTQDETIRGVVASLKEVEAISLMASYSSVPGEEVVEEPTEVLDVTILDVEWWENNKETLLANGWKYEDGTFIYETEDGSYRYDYKNKRLKTPTGDISNCDIAIYGDPSKVTEVFTALKSDLATDSPTSSNTPRLVLIETKSNSEIKTLNNSPKRCNHIYEMSGFGDALLSGLGNNQEKTHTIAGFSAGGLAALRMVSEHPGYYDKLVLFNISPGTQGYANEMYTQDPSPYEGLDVEIVCNYNNVISSRSSGQEGLRDYYTTQSKGPHLDKMVEAGANVTLIVPDRTGRKNSASNDLADYAEGLGVTVREYAVNDEGLTKLTKSKSSHGAGCGLMKYYIEGFDYIER